MRYKLEFKSVYKQASVRISAQVGFFCAVLAITSCGGGGGGGGGGNGGGNGGGSTELKPTHVVNSSANTITGLTETSITLTGDTSSFSVGNALVAAEGANSSLPALRNGLLRKIRSITRGRSETVLETDPASLPDVFSRAVISDASTLDPSKFDKLESLMSGVTIEGGRSRGGRDPLEVHVQLNAVEFSDASGAKLEVSGDLFLKFRLDTQINFDFQGLSYAKSALKATGLLSASISGGVEFAQKKKFRYGHLEGPFIPIVVGGIPLRVQPIVDLYATAEGKVRFGGVINSDMSVGVEAGIEFMRGSGWRPVTGVTTDLNLTPQGNLGSAATGKLSLCRAEMSVLIEGIAGPYVSAELPRLNITLAPETQPGTGEGMRLSADADFIGSGGFKVRLLGLDTADVDFPELLNLNYPFYSEFFPFNGSGHVIVRSPGGGR